MNHSDIWLLIEKELKTSKKRSWPDHVAAQAGIVGDKSGKLMSASLEWKYKRSSSEVVEEMQKELIKKSAIETAAAAIRFLENI